MCMLCFNVARCFIFSRFNNSFLYLVGKVYKKINMDTFTPASELLLKEFRVLVSRSPLPIDSKRLVQVGQVSSSSPIRSEILQRIIAARSSAKDNNSSTVVENTL